MIEPEEFVNVNRPVPTGRHLSSSLLLTIAILFVAAGSVLWAGNGLHVNVNAMSQANAPRQNRRGDSISETASASRNASGSRTFVRNAFQAVPLSFESNQGQVDAKVKFLARGSGYQLFLTHTEAVLKLQHRRGAGESALKMNLAGANPSAQVDGYDELPAKSNYFIGNDARNWHTDVPKFARVRYHDTYPGIDLIFYGKEGQLEYDFEVAPGADPNSVRLNFQGSDGMGLNSKGDLVLRTEAGNVVLRAPKIYQRFGSERRDVDGRFVLTSASEVGFLIGDYDRSRALIIDPQLTYSSYLGGSGDENCTTIAINATNSVDNCQKVAVDSQFFFYVMGSTTSIDFPPQSAIHGTLSGTRNIFVSKFNQSGGLVTSTYLGGNGIDSDAGIAIDAAGNIFLAGTTTSTNFPTLNGIANPGLNAATAHVFVSELKANFSGLTWGTLLGGDGVDGATGLAIDSKGNVYVSGITSSPHFHTTPGSLQPTSRSASDSQFFMAKFTPSSAAGSLVYSTYFGGGNPASGAITQGGGIAVDSSQNVYITGGTNFLHVGAASDFRILNAAQPCLDTPSASPGGCNAGLTLPDVFVAKINPTAAANAALLYSTYLGGAGSDIGNGIAVDSGGNAYVTGSTDSPAWIRAGAPFTYTAGLDVFVAKLNNPAANATVGLNYFTYLGGGGDDTGLAIVVDSAQRVRVTGSTTGSITQVIPPGSPAFQTGPLGGGDAFLASIDTTSSVSTNDFVTGFGGSGLDQGSGVALDTNFATYVAGFTASGDFPTAGTPAQGTLNGPTDAFVSKLGSVSDLQLTATVGATQIGVGNSVTFTFTIKNAGPDPTSGVVFTDNLPGTGVTFTSITSSPGSCASPVGGTVQCSIGTLQPAGTATVTVVLTPTVPFPGGFNDSGIVTAAAGSTDPNLGNNSAAPATPVTVTDFSIAVSPNTFTVPAPAGSSATYQVTATPIPSFPNSVSLSCSAGLPAGAACAFSTNPLAFSSSNSSSPLTSTLTISTTARPVTTASGRGGSASWYAILLPFAGMMLIGMGAGKSSGGKSWLSVALLAVLFGGVMFQVACGGSSSAPPTTGGTPAGTYTVTVTGTSGAAGTSGTASHAATLTLVVQ
jgi:uncharacterized repeat protein (TIGR01451 family)